MTAPPRELAEPAPAGQAPPVIHLPYAPPPAPEKEKKKPKRRRARHVFVRLDDAEFTELEIRARETGLSAGAFCRWKTIGDPGPRSRRAAPTEQERLTADHAAAVKRVGVNINQGIRALNEIALKAPEARSRDRLADEIMMTREILRAMQRAVDEALAADRAALGR